MSAAVFPSIPPVMIRLAITLILLVAGVAFGESIPALTLDQLLSAEAVAVGRFANENGKPEFIIERAIKGEPSEATTRMQAALQSNSRTLVQEGEKLVYHEQRDFRSSDATKSAMWFISPREQLKRVSRQPIELEEGFTALLANQQPDLFFQLMQQADFDLHRSALEQLYATPGASLVERLHEVALQFHSDLNGRAIWVLVQSRLLKPERFWGIWTSHPMADRLFNILQNHDAARAMRELEAAILAEKDPVHLASLLYAIPRESPQRLEITLQYLSDPSLVVRNRVLTNNWDLFYDLNTKALTSPQAKLELSALARRVEPLLEQQLALETDEACKRYLTKMLAKKDDQAWISHIPEESLNDPIPPYSEEAELDFLVSKLTSHSDSEFISQSAGREIVEYFFAEGFKRLQIAGTQTEIFNVDMVFDGMGYLRHPCVFDYLVQHASEIGIGERTFPATLRAIGRQKDKRSLAALEQIVQRVSANKGSGGSFSDGLVDGLAYIPDAAALDYLKELQPHISDRRDVPYLRARAAHGDRWAIDELLARSKEAPPPDTLRRRNRLPREILLALSGAGKVAVALYSVDSAEATDVLKRYVENSWPIESRDPEGLFMTRAELQNYAGNFRRSSPMAELARRDPQWLVSLALLKMADDSLPSRTYAADIFKQLTGSIGEYRPDSFAEKRAQPLQELEAWWLQHQHESREEWLVAYFTGKGFPMSRLDRNALPILAQALSADYFTHNLAVEQISAICGKFFTEFPHQESYQGQKKMNARVLGWLKARGFL